MRVLFGRLRKKRFREYFLYETLPYLSCVSRHDVKTSTFRSGGLASLGMRPRPSGAKCGGLKRLALPSTDMDRANYLSVMRSASTECCHLVL